MELSFITPEDPRYEAELDLRFRVLRAPLGHARADVPFPFERESLHLIAHHGARLLGCVLFYPDSAQGGRLFQMAVEPELQGQGVGRRLVRALEAELMQRGLCEVYLHARAPVVPFYERLGYACHGERFLEVGIEHQEMRRTLSAAH